MSTFKNIIGSNQQSAINNPFFLLFTFYFLLFASCTADPPPTLNYKDREMVDSLFRKEVSTMKPILDSLCNMRHDSAVQHKVDSMIKERQSEIDIYLERIKQEQQ